MSVYFHKEFSWIVGFVSMLLYVAIWMNSKFKRTKEKLKQKQEEEVVEVDVI